MPISENTNKAIFISYCHADNETIMDGGWIEHFHEWLRIRLKQITGARQPEEELGIWRDKELQNHEEFADVLFQKINKVSIVIAVLTPSYISSEWCQREINEFIKAAKEQGGLLVDNQARILKVLKTPVDRDKHPEPLRGQMGYMFYNFDKDTNIPHEFTLLKGDTNNNLALQKINDIAYNIINTLKSLNQAEADNEQLKPERPAVYLAETSFDLDEEQKAIRRELEAWGYKVLPEGELPIRNPDKFFDAVHNALKQCSLSIHMIGESRSVSVAGETDDTVSLQNQLAAEWSTNNPLKRLIWLPQELQPKDDNQQKFIELIQTDGQTQTNAEVLQVAHHELVAVIHDTLDRQSQIDNAKKVDSGHQQIYISYAYEDSDAVIPLVDYLFNSGYDVLEPLSDTKANDQQILDIHKRNLGDCDGAMIFADNAGEYWLKMQLNELQRAAALRGNKPMLTEAIYRTPESVATIKQIRTHYSMINGSNPFNPECLSLFLDQLKGAK